MKVVSFDVLFAMPVGTVFTKYPLGLHELLIKGENEGATFAVQHLSDTDDEDGAELFDVEFEVTGKSFAMDTSSPWVDDDLGVHDSYIVYSADDVGEIIKLLSAALLGYGQPEQATPQEGLTIEQEIAVWSVTSPDARAAASKDLLRRILRAAPPESIQELLKGAREDNVKEVLQEMCAELTGKPLPTMPVSPTRSFKSDMYDLVKGDASPDITDQLEAYLQMVNAPRVQPKNLAIIEAIKSAKGLIWNDHGPTGNRIQLWGVATLDKDDKQQVVALIDCRYFSLNSVYLYQGEAHLSASSVGGVIELHGKPMMDGVMEYNKEHKNFPFSTGTLNNVVQF